ncbi:MAG: lysophospholipid acyltransferase family protein [Bacteroidota bacterium]
MGRLLFYIFLKPLSYLPLPVLYWWSSLIYVLVYKLGRYRVAVVRQNLSNSFPEQPGAQLRQFEQKYYRYLSHLMVEIVKLSSISKAVTMRRCSADVPDSMREFYAAERSIVICVGHYGNWEHFVQVLDAYLPHQVVALYKPLQNTGIDKVFLTFRSRFGVRLIPIEETRSLLKLLKKEPIAIIFLGDQSPTFSKNVEWCTFLHQPTAVAKGAEFFARKFNLPVYFLHPQFPERGQYHLHFELISDQSASTAEGEITTRHTRILEERIQSEPAYWIWSHRRWKRKPGPGDCCNP